jgi:5-methylthioadenosine/S-adenosylhomocysteine deaminase
MPHRLLIRDALMLDPVAPPTGSGRGYLLIEGDRIASTGSGEPPPLGVAEVVDGRTLVAIPGLINTHTHASLSVHRGLCDDADLFGWAAHNYPTIRSLSEREFRLGSELACLDMARAGITTVVECCRYSPILFCQAATSVGIRGYTGGLAVGSLMGREVPSNWPELIAETERALEAYGGDPRCRFFLGAHSTYNCPPSLLREVRHEAERLGIGLGVHLAETRREDALIRDQYAVSPTRYLADEGWLGSRTLAAHVVWPDEEDIDLLSSSGTSVAHCPTSNAKLASGVAPVPRLRQAGVAVGLGTDSTLSNNRLDLFGEMKTAALLQRATTGGADALTAIDVFRMATVEGARAIGWPDLGTLAPGALADVVLLEMDHPLGLTAERALSDLVWATGPQAVRHVLVGGRWVVRDGVLANVDEVVRRRAIAAELRDARVGA